MLGDTSNRDSLLLLTGIYWGEGTKKDFGIINSDPKLIQTFIVGIKCLGIEKERISVSLRVHSNINVADAKAFWAHQVGISETLITQVDVIEGKKKGKLPFGMCRVRIRSGIRERLIVQSLIDIIGKEANKKIVSC